MRTLLIPLLACLSVAVVFAQWGEGLLVSSGFVMEGRVVKGLPYSAHAITSIRQSLVTGSEINSSVTSLVARDSEGRTRREQTLLGIGGIALPRSESPTVIAIQDPVKLVNYLLDPRTHLARMNHQRTPAQQEEARNVEVNRRAEALKREPRTERTESLGVKTIEGLKAEGKRTVTTFPIGSVRNTAPIDVVVETWYSPELQEVLMTRRTDPRSGENTYRLTEIKRGEPAASLFEVPSDYRVETEAERRSNERDLRKEPRKEN
jgi:hypothetical protein